MSARKAPAVRREDLITTVEAAELAGVTVSTYRAYVARGQAPAAFAPGRHVRADVAAWVAARPGEGWRKGKGAAAADPPIPPKHDWRLERDTAGAGRWRLSCSCGKRSRWSRTRLLAETAQEGHRAAVREATQFLDRLMHGDTPSD